MTPYQRWSVAGLYFTAASMFLNAYATWVRTTDVWMMVFGVALALIGLVMLGVAIWGQMLSKSARREDADRKARFEELKRRLEDPRP